MEIGRSAAGDMHVIEIRDIFHELGVVRENVAQVRARMDGLATDVRELKSAVAELCRGCSSRHKSVDDEITDLKTRQAHSNGVAQAKGDLNTLAYIKLGAIFTAVYAVIVALQWFAGSVK
ncbi:MAG: hypothetical protein LDL33_11890 [Desulfomonile sp.]|nr:hypothetical protein [Desulfomonile sp.]